MCIITTLCIIILQCTKGQLLTSVLSSEFHQIRYCRAKLKRRNHTFHNPLAHQAYVKQFVTLQILVGWSSKSELLGSACTCTMVRQCIGPSSSARSSLRKFTQKRETRRICIWSQSPACVTHFYQCDNILQLYDSFRAELRYDYLCVLVGHYETHVVAVGVCELVLFSARVFALAVVLCGRYVRKI